MDDQVVTESWHSDEARWQYKDTLVWFKTDLHTLWKASSSTWRSILVTESPNSQGGLVTRIPSYGSLESVRLKWWAPDAQMFKQNKNKTKNNENP